MGVCITCISWPFLGSSQVSSAPPYIIQLMQGWLMVLSMQHELANRINCEWKVWKWVKVCRRFGLTVRQRSYDLYSLSFTTLGYQSSCTTLSAFLWCIGSSLHEGCIFASVATQDSLYVVFLFLSQDDSSPGSLLLVTRHALTQRRVCGYSLSTVNDIFIVTPPLSVYFSGLM